MPVTARNYGGSRKPVHVRAVVEAPVLVHARRSSTTATLDAAGSLYGRLVPWDTVAEVSDGNGHYRESFAPGGLRATGVVPVYAGHTVTATGVERGPLVGRVDDLESRDDGLYGRVTLADVPAATELRALANLVGATFSVEFLDATPASAEVRRTAAELTGLAVLTAPARGAYAGAEVLAVRARPDPDPDDDDPDEDDEEDQGDPDGDPAEAATEPSLARAVIQREVRRALGRVIARPQPHPLARFGSAFEFLEAARLSASDDLSGTFSRAYAEHHARALADQVTTANPGVIPPGWLSEVFRIIDMGRPVITAIGVRTPPPAGMEIDWPYFNGDLHALVGQQLTEKTEITSVVVSLLKASTPLKTYAGGSDISWQLIRRSQPSYRDAYLRIMQSAYAVVTDQVVGDALPVVPGAGQVEYDVTAADPDGTILRAALFEASADVQVATGSPASVVLAARDVFIKFAGMPTMVPSAYGTQNVTGTAQASTLDVNVSGLTVVLGPDLDAGTAIVTNSQAAAWFEEGPFVVTAPDVPKLGENVAIWGMGAFGAMIPAGIVLLSDTTPLAADDTNTSSTSRSSKK